MIQNEKDLLLKDLCARLPYRPKIWFAESNSNDNLQSIWYDDLEGWQVDGDNLSAPVYAVKPYLFPLSSMTEEQYNEIQTISGKDCMEHMEIEKEWRNNSPFTHLPLYQHRVIEFFHKYHFDYRGLIPMGLAIDATGKNIY